MFFNASDIVGMVAAGAWEQAKLHSDLTIVKVTTINPDGSADTLRAQDVFRNLSASWKKVPVVYGNVIADNYYYQGFVNRNPQDPFLIGIPAAGISGEDSSGLGDGSAWQWLNPSARRQPQHTYPEASNHLIGGETFSGRVAYLYDVVAASTASGSTHSILGLVGLSINGRRCVCFSYVNVGGRLVVETWAIDEYDYTIYEPEIVWSTEVGSGFPFTFQIGPPQIDPTSWLTNLTYVPEHNLVLALPPQNVSAVTDWTTNDIIRRKLFTLNASSGEIINSIEDIGWDIIAGFNIVGGLLIKPWVRYIYQVYPGFFANPRPTPDVGTSLRPATSDLESLLLGYKWTGTVWQLKWSVNPNDLRLSNQGFLQQAFGAQSFTVVNEDNSDELVNTLKGPTLSSSLVGRGYRGQVRLTGVDETNGRILLTLVEYEIDLTSEYEGPATINKTSLLRMALPTNIGGLSYASWGAAGKQTHSWLHVICLNAKTGTKIWQTTLDESTDSDAVADTDSLAEAAAEAPNVISTFGNNDNSVYPPSDPTQKWLPPSTIYVGLPDEGSYTFPGGGVRARYDPDYNDTVESWCGPRRLKNPPLGFYPGGSSDLKSESGWFNEQSNAYVVVAGDPQEYVRGDASDRWPYDFQSDGFSNMNPDFTEEQDWDSIKAYWPYWKGSRSWSIVTRPWCDPNGNSYLAYRPFGGASPGWRGSEESPQFTGEWFWMAKRWKGTKSTTIADSPHVAKFSVRDIVSDPPASPSDGDRYIIGPNPTGDWFEEDFSKEGQIATWNEEVGGWSVLHLWVFLCFDSDGYPGTPPPLRGDRRYLGEPYVMPCWIHLTDPDVYVFRNPGLETEHSVAGNPRAVYEYGRSDTEALAEDPTDFDYILGPCLGGRTPNPNAVQIVKLDSSGTEVWRTDFLPNSGDPNSGTITFDRFIPIEKCLVIIYRDSSLPSDDQMAIRGLDPTTGATLWQHDVVFTMAISQAVSFANAFVRRNSEGVDEPYLYIVFGTQLGNVGTPGQYHHLRLRLNPLDGTLEDTQSFEVDGIANDTNEPGKWAALSVFDGRDVNAPGQPWLIGEHGWSLLYPHFNKYFLRWQINELWWTD